MVLQESLPYPLHYLHASPHLCHQQTSAFFHFYADDTHLYSETTAEPLTADSIPQHLAGGNKSMDEQHFPCQDILLLGTLHQIHS